MVITNLVVCGGGSKGFAHVGVWCFLQDRQQTQNIVNVGGTSVGAIVGMVFSMGATQEYMKDFIVKTDFNQLKDRGYPGTFIYRILNHFGVFRTDAAERLLKGAIKDLTGNGDLTFWQLRNMHIKDPSKFKNFECTASNLSNNKIERYSAFHTPSMKIYEAVLNSMRLPGVFPPGKYMKEQRPYYIVDGGLAANYPLFLFDETRYLEDGQYLKKRKDGTRYNPFTVGVLLETVPDGEPEYNPINNVYDLFAATLDYLQYHANRSNLRTSDKKRSIYVNCGNVKTTDFGLKKHEKLKLMELGRAGAEKWFYEDLK